MEFLPLHYCRGSVKKQNHVIGLAEETTKKAGGKSGRENPAQRTGLNIFMAGTSASPYYQSVVSFSVSLGWAF
jgi:hypothetical protein